MTARDQTIRLCAVPQVASAREGRAMPLKRTGARAPHPRAPVRWSRLTSSHSTTAEARFGWRWRGRTRCDRPGRPDSRPLFCLLRALHNDAFPISEMLNPPRAAIDLDLGLGW